MSFNYRSSDQNRFPGRPHFDINHRPCDLPPKPAGHQEQWRKLWHARVEELLTWYGRIDLMWFDGGGHDNALRDRIRALQPHIVINSRSCDGDYDCTECSLPRERARGWFETCHCWQHSDLMGPNGPVDFWGYFRHEKYRTTAWMLETLVRTRACGANLLINVGPRPDGELADVVYHRFAEAAQWISHSGQSIIGADASPDPLAAKLPITTANRGQTCFLHLLPMSPSHIRLQKVQQPKTVRLLRTNESLGYEQDADYLTINVPESMRTDLVDVVAVEWN